MIRFAEEKDISNIMRFIDKYWHRNHIMSRDRALFVFQHRWGEEVSFVLSEMNGEITGVLGFIPYGRSNRDVTLAIWKTNKTEDTMQGIRILEFLRKNGDVRTVSAAGIAPRTISIYKFLGMNTGKMKQWYRLREMASFKIAKVKNSSIPIPRLCKHIDVTKFEEFLRLDTEFGIDACLIREGQLKKVRSI